MNFGICCVPVSPLMAEASHRAEMVTQLIFGEQCRIVEEGNDNWIRIRGLYDNYQGWCQQYQIQPLEQELDTPVSMVGEWQTEILYNSITMHIPYAAQIPGLVNGSASWGDAHIAFHGKLVTPSKELFNPKSLREIAFTFINSSYLWGGKSVFGVDCSGFCQTVFKFFEIPLMRDASQQATQGEIVGSLQEARCGDLAFFDNTEGRITHVGILLNEAEIIHSSVKVRVDRIDDKGIVNTDTGNRTHQLKTIKRYK